jgi:ribosomal protein L11 methyltransferase
MCIESLEENVLQGMKVLDLGCGSGILEKKKKKLGAEEVVCVDIDPDEFSAWCKKSGMKLNAEARTSYTNEAAYKSLGNISL